MSQTSVAFASPRHCSSAPLIDLDETLRGEGREAGEPDCFRLETPAAGLLMLDLAVPGTAAAEPRLGFLGPACERAVPGLDVIEQSASHLLVSSDAPQALVVCAGSQDPRHELGEFKLRTSFAELDRPAPPKAEQVEVDPDPLAGCVQKAEQVEVDPDPLAGCAQKAEQVEVDPDPLAGPDPLDALCRAHERDDHSDSLLCATAIGLGQSIRGEIANDQGDDYDVFVFELPGAQTVRIETSAEIGTLGGIYDRRGQRLAAAGDEDGGFRLVKTLPAGLYFVRIEAASWSQGAYAFAVNTVERSW